MSKANMMNFTPTPDMISAAESVFIAMAMVETLRPIVHGYQKAILEKCQFKPASEWREKGGLDNAVILDPNNTYLLSEEDSKTYLDAVNRARIAAGLRVKNPDECPLLVAEHLLIQAKRVLIEEMETVTHLSVDDVVCGSSGEFEKLVDLTLRLLSPFVKNAKDILSKKMAGTRKEGTHASV